MLKFDIWKYFIKAEYLINRTKLLNERPISAGYVGGDGDRGSTETYSPNYEEDVRREMFPFIQSLIISVYGICNKVSLISSVINQ